MKLDFIKCILVNTPTQHAGSKSNNILGLKVMNYL